MNALQFYNSLTLQFPLYTGGQLENSIEAAEYGVDAADLTLESTRQTIKARATSAYYRILQCRNMIQVNQEAVDTLAAHLNNVEAQYRVGIVAKSDVLRSQVELANQQQALVNAQNDYDIAIATFNAPRLVALPELLPASDELASDDDPSDAVKRLLDTGTTGLGGARPKASVRLDDGSLAIAKFPHSSDSWDVVAWEATALDLLETAGVRTPQHRLTQVGSRSILILRRFDRTRDGARIGYISAMTATGSSDGDQKDYADLAEAIRDLSRSPVQDLHEFYDRIIASIALGNTDDHLRNHGFLADRGLWRLSPVFDVNPNPDPSRPRATSIMGADAMPDEIDGLLAIANDYRLTQSEARERIRRITASLSGWRGQARANRVPEREITMMSESIEPRLEALTRAAHSGD